MSVAVMAAFATTAPEGSTTLPLIPPRNVCATMECAKSIPKSNNDPNENFDIDIGSPVMCHFRAACAENLWFGISSFPEKILYCLISAMEWRAAKLSGTTTDGLNGRKSG